MNVDLLFAEAKIVIELYGPRNLTYPEAYLHGYRKDLMLQQ